MSQNSQRLVSPTAQAIDDASMQRHFGGGRDLLALWIAEPYIEVAPPVAKAMRHRADMDWFGYETRPDALGESFWTWMDARHGWSRGDTRTLVSPSVGTSIGTLIEVVTQPGDGVIIQPPVFTDFKPLVTSGGRNAIRNPLGLSGDGYQFDLDGLESKAIDASTTALILCNPHNPVGRVWTAPELTDIARICARHDVFVIADEIHADLTLEPHRFTPFATVATEADVRWAALHGPIKTFGLAGVCDTLVITDSDDLADRFEAVSSRLHLTRNNVFSLAAAHAAYTEAADWVDDLLELTATNAAMLRDRLPAPVRLIDLQGTYLAWLDLRGLGMEVPELATWLAESARLALSPGHWFGREGAGFARMTVAAPTEQIEDAITRLHHAVDGIVA
ncbi:MAG: aminotransferase class I/II-fold pyridoxal phosphate-dependent enzyme [Actinomycetia bacterium]|nr:aminotransferase class I/II-fold pyridoxal phosphate-dependent enzyme [Actinomycetes bacterium]